MVKKTIKKKRVRSQSKARIPRSLVASQPWLSKTEAEQVDITLTKRMDVKTSSIATSAGGIAFVHIYWATGNANALPDALSTPTSSATWDKTNLTERSAFALRYAEFRLNSVRYKWIPSNLQITGGPTTTPGGCGITSITVMDVVDVDGPDNTTLPQEIQISSHALQIDHFKMGYGFKNSYEYLRSGNVNFEFVPTSTTNFTNDAGATSFLIEYVGLPPSMSLGTMWVEYNFTYRGRKIV